MRAQRFCIAGYMGAGKSTAAGLIAGDGYRIIDADREAKELMTADRGIRDRLVAAFGASIEERGGLSFSKLGDIVFGAKARLLLLNDIVHPPLLDRLHAAIDSCGDTGCVLDAALAPLWRTEAWFDSCIWVDSLREVRLRRLALKAPERSDSAMLRRMDLQEEVLAAPRHAPWVRIVNNGTLHDLEGALARSGYAP
jgi:dephospho-CoA kinase